MQANITCVGTSFLFILEPCLHFWARNPFLYWTDDVLIMFQARVLSVYICRRTNWFGWELGRSKWHLAAARWIACVVEQRLDYQVQECNQGWCCLILFYLKLLATHFSCRKAWFSKVTSGSLLTLCFRRCRIKGGILLPRDQINQPQETL